MTNLRYAIFLFLMLIALAGCNKQSDNLADEYNFHNYLNLPYSVLSDSLSNLQVRLDSIFGDVNVFESNEKHDIFWDKVLSFAEKKNDKRLWAMAQYRKIHVLRYYWHNYTKAQQEYSKLADYCKKTGFKELEIVCYSQIANQQHHAQQWRACFETCDRLEPLIKDISHETFPDKAAIYHLIGTYYFVGNEYRIALKYLEKSCNTPRIARNYWVILQSYNTSGLAYANLDENSNALKCFNAILNEPFFKQYDQFPDWEVIAKTNIARIGMKEGRYREAIPVMKHTIAHFGSRDESFSCGAAFDLAEAFLKTEKTDSAKYYIQKYLTREKVDIKRNDRYFRLMSLYYQTTGDLPLALAYKDSLRQHEQTEKEELAVADILYQKEVQRSIEVQLKEEKLKRNQHYLFFALGGCVLLAIALGIWINRNRTIVKKNRDLYRQIKEQDRLAEELEAMSKQYEQIVETGRAPSLPGSQQQRQLVSRLRDFLLKERYYAKFDIDIQELILKMSTNRTYLFEALKAVTGKTPMEFLNCLRLDEAKQLLDVSDLNVETIAFECGFSTDRTFYRQFRDRYRITPTEYRNIAKKQG